ncbi:MAG TPA: hydrolase [Gemmatimonadales bacterium]|nr:hydrolase [Gemmatimonadales bacterium]
MTNLSLDPKTTALVLIDLQKGIAAMATAPHTAADVIARAAELARRCRERGATVVLVRVDPGRRGELMPRPEADQMRPPMEFPVDWIDLVPELAQAPGDIVITKHQPNAFYATDLEVQLARRGIRTIVLGGISTNIGVEATARAAHERGYEQVFVEDAMAARDAELHAVATTKFFPTIGRVRSTRDVSAALG